MQTVRLYGRGAKEIHTEKETIRSQDGYIDVPETLVAHLLEEGWSLTPQVEEAFDLHKLKAPEVAAIEGGHQIGGGAS